MRTDADRASLYQELNEQQDEIQFSECCLKLTTRPYTVSSKRTHSKTFLTPSPDFMLNVEMQVLGHSMNCSVILTHEGDGEVARTLLKLHQ
jgi:hypothetical protein